MIKEKIESLIAECNELTKSISDLKQIGDLKSKFLGKSSPVNEFMKSLKEVAPEDRPSFGKIVNECREKLSEIISAKEAEIKENIRNQKL
ncbi:MAG: hypothetical protein RRZ69_06325, partial [Clostridia bacterium]